MARRNPKTLCHYVEHYSLLTNHFHLLLRLGEGSLSRALKFALSRYARWFNRKYELRGHAFQGRFGSLPVQEDRYYATVSRYIHLNPVWAGIVRNPEDYPWSNYAGLISGQSNAIASGGIILSFFGKEEQQQRDGYRRYVEDGISRPDPVNEEQLLRMRSWGLLPKNIQRPKLFIPI